MWLQSGVFWFLGMCLLLCVLLVLGGKEVAGDLSYRRRLVLFFVGDRRFIATITFFCHQSKKLLIKNKINPFAISYGMVRVIALYFLFIITIVRLWCKSCLSKISS